MSVEIPVSPPACPHIIPGPQATWTARSGRSIFVRAIVGFVIANTPNDGAYTDTIDKKGGGTYTYKVCEDGTGTCSNVATVTF